MRRERHTHTRWVQGDIGPGYEITRTRTVVHADGAADHTALMTLAERAISTLDGNIACLASMIADQSATIAKEYHERYSVYTAQLAAHDMLPWHKRLFTDRPQLPIFVDPCQGMHEQLNKWNSLYQSASTLHALVLKFCGMPGVFMYEDHDGLIDDLIKIVTQENSPK